MFLFLWHFFVCIFWSLFFLVSYFTAAQLALRRGKKNIADIIDRHTGTTTVLEKNPTPPAGPRPSQIAAETKQKTTTKRTPPIVQKKPNQLASIKKTSTKEKEGQRLEKDLMTCGRLPPFQKLMDYTPVLYVPINSMPMQSMMMNPMPMQSMMMNPMSMQPMMMNPMPMRPMMMNPMPMQSMMMNPMSMQPMMMNPMPMRPMMMNPLPMKAYFF